MLRSLARLHCGVRAASAVVTASARCAGAGTASWSAGSAVSVRALSTGPVLVVRAAEEPKRGFLQRTMEKFQEKRGQEFFQEHIKWLSTLERFSLQEFREQMVKVEKSANMGGIGNWLSSIKDHPSMHEIARSKVILDHLTEEERLNPERVDRVVKRRVAEATKTDPAAINEVLRRYQLSAMLHQWIRQRVAEGKPLPKNQEELETAIRASTKRRTARVG